MAVSLRQAVPYSGRFILSQLRSRNICLQISQINCIFVIACMPRKCKLIDIKVTTSSGLVGVGGRAASIAAGGRPSNRPRLTTAARKAADACLNPPTKAIGTRKIRPSTPPHHQNSTSSTEEQECIMIDASKTCFYIGLRSLDLIDHERS
jgi:hypothetical protein